MYKGTECINCVKLSLCTKLKAREILLDIREPLMNKMREKLVSVDGALKYFKRQYTIEPIFGHLKYNLGYKSFLVERSRKSKSGVYVNVYWVESEKDVKNGNKG